MDRPPVQTALQAAIERLWQERIPLATHLELRLVRLDDQVLELTAPLTPNRNHMGTGFAGSLVAAASLAGWGVVIAMLERMDAAQVVAQEMSASFIEPVTGDFRVRAHLPPDEIRDQFLRAFRRHRRARVAILAEIMQDERVAARVESRFVALQS